MKAHGVNMLYHYLCFSFFRSLHPLSLLLLLLRRADQVQSETMSEQFNLLNVISFFIILLCFPDAGDFMGLCLS